MRIGITGMSIESSTFSPYINGEKDFAVLSGDDMKVWYPFLNKTSIKQLLKKYNVELVFLTRARSIPGGAVDNKFYKKTKEKIVNHIKKENNKKQFDGILLDIHGAMSVVGMTDSEYDLTKEIRKSVGPNTQISATMDLHGNVSKELLSQVDLLTCYRLAPHEDDMETKERAFVNLIKHLDSRVSDSAKDYKKLYKAWVKIPVLLPGEKTSTRLEPAKSLYKQVGVIEKHKQVLDAALFVGYAWADEKRCCAYVIVTGYDKKIIVREATKLAKKYWRNRDNFKFVGDALPIEKCMESAYKHIDSKNNHMPYVISDSGDNPTAGGAGDVTWTLKQILSMKKKETSGIYASLFDKNAVKKIVKAGVGSIITVSVGANVDNIHSGPVELKGTVHHIYFPQVKTKNTGSYSSDSIADGGIEAVVNVDNLYVIITEKRKPYHHKNDFYNLNLKPEKVNLLFVKIGYLEPELFDLSQSGKYWKLGLTPGGVDQDLIRLGHKNIEPKTFPFYVPDRIEATEIENNLLAEIVE